MPKILQTGYEHAIRTKLGVKTSELPDDDINQRTILDLAEALVIKRVPGYELITDVSEKLYLETAVIALVCVQLCPGMARRLNLSVATIDVKWQKDKVNWGKLADGFEIEYESALLNIQSVPTSTGFDKTLLRVIHGPTRTANGG